MDAVCSRLRLKHRHRSWQTSGLWRVLDINACNASVLFIEFYSKHFSADARWDKTRFFQTMATELITSNGGILPPPIRRNPPPPPSSEDGEEGTSAAASSDGPLPSFVAHRTFSTSNGSCAVCGKATPIWCPSCSVHLHVRGSKRTEDEPCDVIYHLWASQRDKKGLSIPTTYAFTSQDFQAAKVFSKGVKDRKARTLSLPHNPMGHNGRPSNPKAKASEAMRSMAVESDALVERPTKRRAEPRYFDFSGSDEHPSS